MRHKILTLSALSLATFFTACDKEASRPDLVIPEVYDGSSFEANAATELNVREQLRLITAEAYKGRTPGTVVDYATLSGLLNAGSPSLKAVGSTYYLTKMDGVNGWLDELAKASGGTFTPGVTTGSGGTYGAYLFDENGLELEQVMEKGMFGAVLYKHAVDVMNGPITSATSDKVLAIFGSNPSFPNSNNASKHPKPDVQIAVYAARRTDSSDVNGLYFQIKRGLIKLQAAAKAGADYEKEQKEAIEQIKLNWEKANAATIINYCFSSISTLSGASPTDAQKASAIHAIAEGIGFIHGFRTVSSKKITEAQIDEVLTLLNAPATNTPTVYKFVTEPVAELPKLQQVIDLLKNIYGFSTAEIESFKNNWVSLQGR